jgi:DNA-binding transcriptional regulator YiaG
MSQLSETQRSLVEMLRMSDAEMALYMQGIIVAQLIAGYDYFTWEGMTTAPPSPTTADEALPLRVTGAGLKTWRLEQTMTQKTLGSRLGVSGATVSDWENGHAQMSIAVQQQLRALMSLSNDEREAKD